MSVSSSSRADWLIIVSTTLLLALSVLMVFSTTAVPSRQELGDATYLLRRHLLQILIGLVAMGIGHTLPVRGLYRAALPFLVLSGALLILVLAVGQEAGGARRWLAAGPLRFQPGEIAKLVVVVYVASYIGRHCDRMLEFVPGVLIPVGVASFFCILLLAQPDFGSTAILIGVVFFQLLGYSRLRHLALCGAGAAGVLLALVLTSPYRLRRVEAFLSPLSDASSSGYQLVQSLIAVGSGGLFGSGLGVGKQKLYYLPAAHTDFIYAVVAEELGLVGAGAVIVLFGMFGRAGFALARRHIHDPFRSSLALGCTLLIVLPAVLNIGVVIGLLPTKGLVLPLVAYGGTAMVVNLLIVGILLRLSRSIE